MTTPPGSPKSPQSDHKEDRSPTSMEKKEAAQKAKRAKDLAFVENLLDTESEMSQTQSLTRELTPAKPKKWYSFFTECWSSVTKDPAEAEYEQVSTHNPNSP